MPLSKEHKQRTRTRIIAAAGKLFRLHGYNGTGIEQIMAAAGLTRGGFYAHFKSKADLFAAVVEGPHWFNKNLAARKSKDGDALLNEALDLVGIYLNPDYTDYVAENCPLVSLSRDVARAEPGARKALSSAVRHLVGELSRGLSADQAPNKMADPRALATLALCVGSVTIARTADDPALSEAFLKAGQMAAAGLMEKPAAKKRRKSSAKE